MEELLRAERSAYEDFDVAREPWKGLEAASRDSKVAFEQRRLEELPLELFMPGHHFALAEQKSAFRNAGQSDDEFCRALLSAVDHEDCESLSWLKAHFILSGRGFGQLISTLCGDGVIQRPRLSDLANAGTFVFARVMWILDNVECSDEQSMALLKKAFSQVALLASCLSRHLIDLDDADLTKYPLTCLIYSRVAPSGPRASEEVKRRTENCLRSLATNTSVFIMLHPDSRALFPEDLEWPDQSKPGQSVKLSLAKFLTVHTYGLPVGEVRKL